MRIGFNCIIPRLSRVRIRVSGRRLVLVVMGRFPAPNNLNPVPTSLKPPIPGRHYNASTHQNPSQQHVPANYQEITRQLPVKVIQGTNASPPSFLNKWSPSDQLG